MTPDLSAVFQCLGVNAVFTPSEGDAVPCQAIPAGGGETFTFGKVTVTAERPVFHMLRSEIGTPKDGSLTVEGTPYSVEAGEPVEGDPRGLLWSVIGAWGVPLEWTTPGSGGGSPYDPPDPALTYTARAASAGSTTFTIQASGWTSGRVRAGDGIQVDGGTYEATNTVEIGLDSATMSYVFRDVGVTPALTGTLDGGEAVVFVPAGASNTRTVRAAVADYEAFEVAGGVLASDRRLIVRGDDIEGEPTTSDMVTLDGASWSVVSVQAVHVGDDVVAYVCQVRA